MLTSGFLVNCLPEWRTHKAVPNPNTPNKGSKE